METTVRRATADDAAFIARLAAEADMGVLSPKGTSYVAWRGGERLGFVRIVEADGRPYVNPIVVDAAARGLGAGEALMRFAGERYGTLGLIARGTAVPFYERLGGAPVPWGAIAGEIAADCDGCPDRAACNPTPMRV